MKVKLRFEITLDVSMFQALWATTTLSFSLEVGVPERYLRPRNFNPHPYTDVVDPGLEANLLQQSEVELEGGQLVRNSIPDLPEHPYALFRRPLTRSVATSSCAPTTPATLIYLHPSQLCQM